jgi:hypothetical protein
MITTPEPPLSFLADVSRLTYCVDENLARLWQESLQ